MPRDVMESASNSFQSAWEATTQDVLAIINTMYSDGIITDTGHTIARWRMRWGNKSKKLST